jgi:DHA2 family multidrug resistance protein
LRKAARHEIVVIPLSGWLRRVVSTRWLFAASAAGFTAASLLSGCAWDIQSMIVFRALQGFLAGLTIPTVFTSAFFFFEGKQRVFAASMIGGLASLAPTFGSVVGSCRGGQKVMRQPQRSLAGAEELSPSR